MDATAFDEAQIVARIDKAVDRHWRGAALHELRPLPGGTSSLTFTAMLIRPGIGDEQVVVKVAPPGLAPVGNRDVLRQSRLLRLLEATPAVRVPAVLLEDSDDPPLFVMNFLPGEAYEPLVDMSPDPPSAPVIRARAQAAARMLAQLHRIDPAQIGVSDQATSVADELDRWIRLFATVDDELCPGHAELRERLRRAIPEATDPKVLHGDYRVGNMLFLGEQLQAVIDWEIWTIGDPRTDLAWLLMLTDPLHRFHEPRDERNTEAGRGMPSLKETLDIYLDAQPGEVADLEWFLAYCQYKTAAILSVFVKRNHRRPEPDPMLLVAERMLPEIIGRGNEILDTADAGEHWQH